MSVVSVQNRCCYSKSATLLSIGVCLLMVVVISAPSIVSRCLPSYQSLPATIADDLLRREALFRNTPPDIRHTEMRLFNASGLVDLLDHLAEDKITKRAAPKEDAHFTLRRYNETRRFDPERVFHFAFVGDSRVRLLFTAFYKSLPRHDTIVYPEGVEFTESLIIPKQMVVYSELLRSIISFNWYPVLVEYGGRDLFKFLNRWLGQPDTNEDYYKNRTLVDTPHPDVLVIGLASHHMIQAHRDAREDVYFKKLRELVPVLKRISASCRVIWLSQYPTINEFARTGDIRTDVHSEKIWHYDQQAASTLTKSGVPVWNSGSPIVEEYIRGCLLFKRKDGYYRGFFSCTDYIHPGLNVVTDMIQILNNYASSIE